VNTRALRVEAGPKFLDRGGRLPLKSATGVARSRSSAPPSPGCAAFPFFLACLAGVRRRRGERGRGEGKPRVGGSTLRRLLAFTLLELLTVIAIIGILAALAAPLLNNFKPNYRASAVRQLLDDIGRARQLAISERTTVLMVFVPTNFWSRPISDRWRPRDWVAATNLFDKQLIGYNFVSLRSLGDQPGVHYPQYLSQWRALPEGAFIALEKFNLPPLSAISVPFIIYTNKPPGLPVRGFDLYGFSWTWNVPFPLLDTPVYNPLPNRQRYALLPYLAFNYLGQRCDENGNVIQLPAVIPLAKGAVGFGRDPTTKMPTPVAARVYETPPGNATNNLSYNVIVVDWLTGRARAYQQEIQ
jgi:prepilin-type N-terminal cleavage/methylation domain-containing protein